MIFVLPWGQGQIFSILEGLFHFVLTEHIL